MCDCYDHPCEVCGRGVPMHIADFAYPQSDFRVWCGTHVRKAPPEAKQFRWTVGRYNAGGRCAILGPSVGVESGNHPNVATCEEIAPRRRRKG